MEFLKEYLGEELYAQVETALAGHDKIRLANVADGSFVPVDKFNRERESGKAYRQQIQDLNSELESNKEALVQYSESVKRVASLEKELKKKTSEYEAAMNAKTAEFESAIAAKTAEFDDLIGKKDAEIASQHKRFAVRDAVRDGKAKNADVVMKMIDMDAITVEDGKLVGITEQIDNLKKSDSYLFEDAGSNNGGFPMNTEPDVSGKNVNTEMNSLIRLMAGR